MTDAALVDSAISECRRFLADDSGAIREGDSVPSGLTCGSFCSVTLYGSVLAVSVYHNVIYINARFYYLKTEVS